MTFHFQGRKGGQSGSGSYTTTPDNLRSKDNVEAILAIGEGPLQGLRDYVPAVYPDNKNPGFKNLFIGDTPLLSADGEWNFKAFVVDPLHGHATGNLLDGTASTQEFYNPQLGGTASNSTVNVTLETNTPVVRVTQSTTTEADSTKIRLDAIDIRLVISQLFRQDTNGTYEETLQFKIEYKPLSGGAWTVAHNNAEGFTQIKGKTTSAYVKELRIAVDRISEPYQVRITKLSPPNTTDHFRTITWESFQEVEKQEVRHPFTAMLRIFGQASDQFSSIPEFTGIWRGLIIKCPSNLVTTSVVQGVTLYTYDRNRYSTTWDGTFTYCWTDNPAWILYDYVTNERYGLSTYSPVTFDKWDVYEAAQWCDQMIASEAGGSKPRFTFNGIISEPRQGKEVARFLAGTFNAVFFDDLNGTALLRIDKEEQATHIFAPENVINGMFEYTFADVTTRYNDIIVSFTNPDIGWEEDRRRVFLQDHIDQFGRIPYEFQAIGCTSADEAKRRARYKLATSVTEICTVTFKTNRFGCTVLPFNIILIADPQNGYSLSGRIVDINEQRTRITLRDKVFLEAGVSYRVKAQYPNPDYPASSERPYLTAAVAISGSPTGLQDTFNLALALPSTLPANAQVIVEPTTGDKGTPKPFRVLKIDENDGDPDNLTIIATEVNRNKWQYVDQGIYEAPPNYYVPRQNDAAPPTDLFLTDVSYTGSDGTFRPQLRVDWTRPADKFVTGYEVQHKLSNDADFNPVTTLAADAEFHIFTSVQDRTDYTVRVRSFNAFGRYSVWAEVTGDNAIPNDAPPGQPTSLTAVGGYRIVTLNWANPGDLDLLATEIWVSATNNLSVATKLAEVSTTSFIHSGLGSEQTRYYWVRAVDRSRNVSEFNSNLGASATTTYIDGSEIKIGSAFLPSLLQEIRPVDLTELQEQVEGAIETGEATKERVDRLIGEEITRFNQLFGDGADFRKQLSTLAQAVLTISDQHYKTFEEVKAERGSTSNRFSAVSTQITELTDDHQSLAQQVIVLGSEFDDNVATITSRLTTLANDQSATAISLTELTAEVDDNKATYTSFASAQATTNEAVSTQLIELKATTDGNTAAISNEQTARTTADEALAEDITTIGSKVDENYGLFSDHVLTGAKTDSAMAQRITALTTRVGNAETAISTEQNSRAEEDDALAEQIVDIGAIVGDNFAIFQDHVITGVNKTGALAERITNLTTKVDGNYATFQDHVVTGVNTSGALAQRIQTLGVQVGNAFTGISNEQTARINAVGAVSNDLTTLGVRVDGAYTGITTERDARILADGTMSTRIDNIVSLEIGPLKGNVEALQQVVTGPDGIVTSKYEIKVDATGPSGKKTVAGIGLYADSSGNNEFIVRADKFLVYSPSAPYDGQPIFAIGPVNGSNKIVMNAGLYLPDNAISARMVTANAIQASHIAAGAIVADKISASQITTDKITIGGVTTDRIMNSAVSSGGGNGANYAPQLFFPGTSVNVTEWGQPVLIVGAGRVGMTIGGEVPTSVGGILQLQHNGFAAYEKSASSENDLTIVVIDYPGPGTHFYGLGAPGHSSTGVTNLAIAVFVFKR